MRRRNLIVGVAVALALGLFVFGFQAFSQPNGEGITPELDEPAEADLSETEEVVGTPTPTPTPTVVGTPTPSPTPTVVGTPTPTPTPAPSAGTMQMAAALQGEVADLQQALAFGDREGVLQAQRTLLAALEEAEAVAEADEAPGSKPFREAVSELRDGLAGDTARLASAQRKLADFAGTAATDPFGMPGTGPAPSVPAVEPIADIGRYARNLADKVESLETAQGGELLRLQNEVLSELERGEAALGRSNLPQAELVRSALQDLEHALGGDAVKYQSAVSKLRQAAGQSGTDIPDGRTTPGATADLQPIVNELNNRLEALRNAANNEDQQGMESARQALNEQLSQAQAQLSGDQSARANRLRNALGPVREAAAGDDAKIEAARAALQEALSGQ